MSEDSEDMFASGRPSLVDATKTSILPPLPVAPSLPLPFVNIIRQETTSTESKETLTPLELSEEHTLVDEDVSTENIADLNFENAKQRAIRRRVGRRNSDNLPQNDINRSQNSLNANVMTRRQLSLTQSEADSDQCKLNKFLKKLIIYIYST